MDTTQLKPLLTQNSWFNQLPEPIIEKLVLMCRQKHLVKGQRLFAKNDAPEGLYCLISGRMRVSNVNHEGKEMVLTWLEPGAWFGEISLFDGLPRTHDSHAETDASVLLLPINTFHELLAAHPEIYPHFMKLLCQRVRATFSLIDETGGLSLKGQLARRLLLLSNGLDEQRPDQENKPISISQESLAHMLNSSRQTVNKLLQELQTEQILRVHYGKITLLDIQRLTALTQL